jgi:transcriptional regulator with XRE-family HTH domain
MNSITKNVVIQEGIMNKKPELTNSLRVTAYIKQHAKERGVNMREVARSIGISPSYLSEFMAGKKRPSPHVLSSLADYFKVPRVEVYNAAGWVSFDSDEHVVIQFREMAKRDPNLLELFDILVNIPEVERQRIVRFLLVITKDRAEEPSEFVSVADSNEK